MHKICALARKKPSLREIQIEKECGVNDKDESNLSFNDKLSPLMKLLRSNIDVFDVMEC